MKLTIDSFKVGDLFLYFDHLFKVTAINKRQIDNSISASDETNLVHVFYENIHFDEIKLINDKLKPFI